MQKAYKPLDKERMQMLMNIIMMPMEAAEDIVKKLSEEFTSTAIVNKRQSVLAERASLPKLDDKALLLTEVFCTSPGEAVIYYIDCINYGQENNRDIITNDDVCMEIFPNGFYTESTIRDIIDHMKKGEYKNHEIY